MILIILKLLVLVIAVPYQSQEAVGWYKFNDCGPAVAEMVYEYYTGNVHTVRELYQEFDMSEDKGMSGFVLRQWFREHGLSSEYTTGNTLDWLLAQDTPVIVEIDYSVFRHAGILDGDTWDLHFVVVVGHADNYIVIHDPLTGPYKVVPLSLFEEAWSLPYNWVSNPATVVSNE